MHQEIIRILQQRTEHEDHFDELASVIIDNESKAGRNISLHEAYKIARASEPDSKQDERLQKIQAIVSGSMFETKHQLIKRQKLLLGYIAKDDPLLAQYDILTLNFSQHTLGAYDSNKGYTAQQDEAFCREAKKVVKKPKTYVLCRHITSWGCQILYFENPADAPEKIIIPFDHVYRDELFNKFIFHYTPQHVVREQSNRLIRFALLSHQYPDNLQNFLIFAAAKNNNAKILRYFIRLALQLKVDISRTLKQCLDVASGNGCTSNVRAILSGYKSIPAGFRFHYGPHSNSKKFYLGENTSGRDLLSEEPLLVENTSLIKEGKLNTQSSLVEIFYILADYKCEDLKLQNYFSVQRTDHEKREIISINLLIYKHLMEFQRMYQLIFHQEFYNSLIDLLNYHFSDNKPLSLEFYRNNFEMFQYADAKKMQSLGYLGDLFEGQENFTYMQKIVRQWGGEDSKLEQMQNFLSIEGALALRTSASCKGEKLLLIKLESLSKNITQKSNAILNTFLPSDITSIVQQYMIMPSFLEEYYKTIYKLTWQSSLELKGEDEKHIWKFKTPIQEQKSSDCGYWSLFNMFRIFTTTENKDPEDEKGVQDLFLQKFKPWVQKILSKRLAGQEDLTVLDLDKVISVAQEGDDDLLKMFPALQKNLLTYQEGYGIPAYTLINSVLCDGENKLDHSYTFGGCLPYLKVQIATHFYQLSQLKEQPIFHFVFIGTNEHWHVQLLKFSHYSRNSQSIIRLDSSATPEATVTRINLHIQDLLNNPLNYAKNIAEEVLPMINDDLIQFNKMLAEKKPLNFQQNETALNYCMAIVKFFSTFDALEIIKPHLPVLQNAHKLARKCREHSDEFKGVTQELALLCRLQVKHHLSQQHFLTIASASSAASSLPDHSHATHFLVC